MKRYRRVVSTIRWTVCEAPDDVRAPRRVTSAESACRLFHAVVGDSPTEHLVALLLGTKRELLGVSRVSSGTVDSSLVHPREVFGPALRESASAIIVIHNHPSGDPQPSSHDLAVRTRLEESGIVLGVPMLDFIVVGRGLGRGSHWSAEEEGMMNR